MSTARLDWREIERALTAFFESQGAFVDKAAGDWFVDETESISLTELARYLAEHIDGPAP
jgi:hypothetical protein